MTIRTALNRRSARIFAIAGVAAVASLLVAGASESDAFDSFSSPTVGAPAPQFTAVDTRGTSHSLSGYKGKWVVLEWVNHECPYTRKHYVPLEGGPGNTQAMQEEYGKRGVIWLSVVSSAPGKQGYTSAADADRLTREKGATPTGLIRDTTGALGRLYDARTTPQYAIIDPEGVLRYAGAIDDRRSPRPSDIAGATNYVRAALDAGMAGKPIAVPQTQPYGCDVKY